jgi:hypothetical protein
LRTISSSIVVDAPIERVTIIVTNFPAYTQWNRMVRWIRGEFADGANVDVRLRTFPFPVTFKGKMSVPKADLSSQWSGHLLMRGLIDLDTAIQAEGYPAGGTRLVEVTTVSGLLEPFFHRCWNAAQQALVDSHRALKARAEEVTATKSDWKVARHYCPRSGHSTDAPAKARDCQVDTLTSE